MSSLRPKFWPIFERIAEDALLAGYEKAHRHNDTPKAITIIATQMDYLKNAMDEYLEEVPNEQ